MSDIFSKEKRSEVMSLIRGKNTKIERFIFKGLRKKGIYFQKHYKKATGTPDLALPKKKLAIFIDGDFWHGYNFSKIKKRLSKKYWIKKIEGNIARDRINRRKLKRGGWKILRVWEHEIENDLDRTVLKIINFLEKNN